MGPKKKIEQMLTYINEDLSQKGFNLQTTSDENRFSLSKSGHKSGLLLVNRQIPMNEFYGLHRKNITEFENNHIIFYKDGKIFFKRMVDTNSWRQDKSLKQYSQQEINQMIILTIQEKYAIFKFDKNKVENIHLQNLRDKKIIYYQPPTERLEEGIRKFQPVHVSYDYSHIDSMHSGYGFAKEGNSKLYFFLEELLE